MKYKINGFLYYDAIDGTLKLEGQAADDTQLSITANALLFFLIQHPGVLTRDEVMKKVWDDNGLISSNSNLNQYLSLLRKSFRSYDIENVIVTIPRGRLEFNPELVIEVVDDNHLHPLLQQASDDKEIAPEPLVKGIKEQEFPPQTEQQERNWMIASAILFIAALGLLWTAIITERSLHIVSLTEVESGLCELFSPELMINSAMGDKYVTNFKAVRDKLGLSCAKHERFIFYYGDKLQSNGLGRTYIARCAENENNPYAYCDNYFYYSWKK
ncbi:winged helix-turn-helix domain-containing protein [Photobacterium alginatilyticum]|uniref:Winged helix family transcriptional regulator n=1 Tax=Photobacterium alginatilyticum TaxID=1775171 RepID=A0ABW9YF27_9GAMM|nr:winged helix-turn-helix domain-containing protein [Photobacterium alginatilyticum]NBI52372.1 winged helix family transcriptional regulator [Photobacterium alginatilyticum]